MAPESPQTYYKLGPALTTATNDIEYYRTSSTTYTYGNVPLYSERREFSVPEKFQRLYESELRAARARPSLEKLKKQLGWIYLWRLSREAERRSAERPREPPATCPPKARTEWGMVHRERCVHRMGLN